MRGTNLGLDIATVFAVALSGLAVFILLRHMVQGGA
jgi:hypothetical protein